MATGAAATEIYVRTVSVAEQTTGTLPVHTTATSLESLSAMYTFAPSGVIRGDCGAAPVGNPVGVMGIAVVTACVDALMSVTVGAMLGEEFPWVNAYARDPSGVKRISPTLGPTLMFVVTVSLAVEITAMLLVVHPVSAGQSSSPTQSSVPLGFRA